MLPPAPTIEQQERELFLEFSRLLLQPRNRKSAVKRGNRLGNLLIGFNEMVRPGWSPVERQRRTLNWSHTRR